MCIYVYTQTHTARNKYKRRHTHKPTHIYTHHALRHTDTQTNNTDRATVGWVGEEGGGGDVHTDTNSAGQITAEAETQSHKKERERDREQARKPPTSPNAQIALDDNLLLGQRTHVGHSAAA